MRGLPITLFDHEAVCDAIRAAGDFYEAQVLDAVRERRPRELGIVDAGAHIGNHSLYWLAFVRPAWLLACEPQPEVYELLVRNLAPYSQASAWQVALSDLPRTVLMRPDEVNRGRTTIAPDGTLAVPAVALDDVPLPGNLSLVKVDVEGHQASVLLGAYHLLHRHHPALLVEDGEGVVERTLGLMHLGRYRCVGEWPGANYLWEWQ